MHKHNSSCIVAVLDAYHSGVLEPRGQNHAWGVDNSYYFFFVVLGIEGPWNSAEYIVD
jgi:hypothetical protein